jgi:flagellar biosynthesis/type III secretory pathway M-ring protein FliF/YscJ
LRRAQIIEAATPEQRGRIVQAIAESDNAVNVAEGSVLASLAPTVKWIAIGIGAFLLYRAYMSR